MKLLEKKNMNSTPEKTSQCYYHNKGFCKNGNMCLYRHHEDICEINECSELNCDKRHPRNCKYFEKYKYCKFGSYCKFRHKLCEKTIKNEEIVEKLRKI